MSRIDEHVQRLQERYARVLPDDLVACVHRGDLLVDLRPQEQRDRDGVLPQAVVIGRDVLEWRLDPTCQHSLPLARDARRIVLVCNEGYSSSLAVASLLAIGLSDVTDVAGGFQALRRSGTLEDLRSSAEHRGTGES